jgi:internalin A
VRFSKKSRTASGRIAAAMESRSTELDLSRLSLTELPEAIGQLNALKQLQRLNLSFNQLTKLPESIGQLTQLQQLDLSDNKLAVIPDSIGQCTELQVVRLSSNRLTTLPESIGKLTKLQILNVLLNRLAALPESIGKLTNLRELYLRDNLLSNLPESIGQLKNLQKILVWNNQLTALPESIGKLTKLPELSLAGNRLAVLPESIGRLTQLKVLDLSENRLTELPESVGQLSRLKELNLSFNGITELPESVGRLTLLKRLDLSFNQISRLPESVGRLTALVWLDLSDNQLTEVPDSIGKLAKLQTLLACGNELTELSESVGRLTTLVQLDLSDNLLDALPASAGQLIQLKALGLSGNLLPELPETIGGLEHLHMLNLADNRLDAVPHSLRKLGALRELYLHGNDQLDLPSEVLGPTMSQVYPRRGQGATPADPSQILEYYFRVRIDRRPLNEAKLILVGRGGSGKTSIVNRLVHYRFDPSEKKTEGIRITGWKLQLKRSEDVRLNIWDFGGQEIMHATHQFFLTQRSLYLLVLNGREGTEDADAEYWLRIIESFGRDSPVIVVLNKIKEHAFEVNRRGLQQKFPAIRDFIKTDCEDGTGSEELRKAIERETDRLEHLRDAFPASWFGIKDRLAGMRENYLTFDKYRQICAELGEEDPSAQEALAFYLHGLGIVLNYRDDPRLQDTHVLNPHWVTNGIYTILNPSTLAKQKGEISLNDVSGILKAGGYPGRMHLFLFDLMKKFDLCFAFPGDETCYLIPELLDKQEPEASAEFTPEECLNFQYHYPVLPEGLLPRFIVRTRRLSEGLARWRTGVILKFESNMALVKADVQDKKVFISISGPVHGRRRLLAVIRSDIDMIHSDINRLYPTPMVPLPDFPIVVIPYNDLIVMEERGIKHFTKVVGSEVIELDVEELLNGIDLDRIREKGPRAGKHKASARIFYSYSHKDESLRDQLETHLKILQRSGLIESWHDRNIGSGEEWKRRIDENLEAADVILLLVSADFIASDYCFEKEMKRALERHKEKKARVVPVILRDCNWKKAPFAWLQALPRDGRAVTKWRDKDSAWRNISEGIEKVIYEMRKKS